MNFTVDSSSPVRGWRAVRSIAENAPSWMRGATCSRCRTSSTSRMCPVPRARRNISEMCTVSPGRAYVSSSRNFGRWRGWRRLEVPRVLLEGDRVLDPGLVQDEVLPGGGLLVGRDALVDQVRHRRDPSVRRIGPYLSSNPVSNHHRI
jgi:hypothetical protein